MYHAQKFINGEWSSVRQFDVANTNDVAALDAFRDWCQATRWTGPFRLVRLETITTQIDTEGF